MHTSFTYVSPGTLCRSFLICFTLLLAGLTAQAQTTWNGSTDRNWNTAGNWSAGVPTATSDAVIPNGPANQPIISTTTTAKSVEVQSGASLSISSAGSLMINDSKNISGFTNALFSNGTVTNSGQIILNITASTSQFGIWNQGTFTNTGQININRTTAQAVRNAPGNAGTFINSGTITIGASATVGQNGILNQATFQNNAGGLIRIDQLTSTGAGIDNNSSGATFTNSATITIGASTSLARYGISNSGAFSNVTNGTIQIDRTGSTAIVSSSTFVNAAVIKIGSLTTVGGQGITNSGSFTNNLGGNISINRTNTGAGGDGVYSTGTFFNAGRLTIGDISFRAQDNIYTQGTFTNTATGEINADGAAGFGNGIWSNGGTFQNSGRIVLGANAITGSSGILSTAPFTNNTGGEIVIDRCTGNAVVNANSQGVFTNAGRIRIGQNFAVGNFGLVNSASAVFRNNAGGEITIDRTGNDALANLTSATLVNSATITIGFSGSIANDGIDNSATFSNSACAVLIMFDNLDNSGDFTNAGLFTVSTTQPHTNSGTLVNNGIISYPQGNPIPNVTNNGAIAFPLQLCYQTPYTPALQLGSGSSNLTVGPLWYTDPSLSTPAGGYNQGTNTFEPTFLNAINPYQLSFPVNDAANGCVRTVTTSATVSFPVSITAQPVASSVLCEFGSVSVPVGVTGTALSYQWYKDDSPVPGQTSATLSLPSAQPSDTGTYSLVVTGSCNVVTSSTFSLSVGPAPMVTLIFGNNATVMGTGTPTITVPPSSTTAVFQATGGTYYERSWVLDRINGYEIRQSDFNTSGIFPINRLGLFTLTVTGSGSCKRTVQAVLQGQ